MPVKPGSIMMAVPCRNQLHDKSWFALTVVYSWTREYWREHREGSCELVTTDQAHVLKARNELAKIAMKDGFDWIIWFDDDAAPLDGEGKPILDIVDRLMHFDKKWIVPVFFQRIWPFKCTIGNIENDKLVPIKVEPRRLEKVQCAGFHAMLMHTDVIKNTWEYVLENAEEEHRSHLGKHLFRYDGVKSEDVTFCLEAEKAGNELWCYTGLDVGHVGEVVIDRKYHYLAHSKYGKHLKTS